MLDGAVVSKFLFELAELLQFALKRVLLGSRIQNAHCKIE